MLEEVCERPHTGGSDELRIVIVDDHVIFTDLLALALRHEEGLVCVGTATTAAMAMALVDHTRPDVVIMDVELGDAGGDGIEATTELTDRYPDLRVVVLTARVNLKLMQRAADARACSLLPKNGPLLETLQALRTARAGELTVGPALLMQLMARPPAPDQAPLAPVTLTARERETLQALSEGLDVRRMAAAQGISQHTCRGHVRRLLSKLGAHSQLEAVAVAHKHGLLRDAAD
jgi:DNA-binding NarL/FixJ family response regulator